MRNQLKNHSILKVMLLSVYFIVFLEPSILSAQDTEAQTVEQSQEELNQALFSVVSDSWEDDI